MNTEAINNNSPPNQEDEDSPLSGDVDFPFEEPVEVEHRNSCFRLTPQFSAGLNAMAKTSERVDRECFSLTNESVLATPNGMLRLLCKDDIKCVGLNLSDMAGVPACDSEQTSPDQAESHPCKALNFTKDAGEDEEVDIFPFPVFGQIINIPCQARNFKPLARLTQGNRVHGTSSSPTCALLWSMRSTGWPFCIKTN